MNWQLKFPKALSKNELFTSTGVSNVRKHSNSFLWSLCKNQTPVTMLAWCLFCPKTTWMSRLTHIPCTCLLLPLTFSQNESFHYGLVTQSVWWTCGHIRYPGTWASNVRHVAVVYVHLLWIGYTNKVQFLN